MKTEANGSFSVPLLPPGDYSLRIRAKGFKSYEQKGITLVAEHSVRQDIELPVGTENEQVEVTSQAPLLNTGDANLSAEITSAQVEALPLNLRNVVALATLNSSVSNTSDLDANNYFNNYNDSPRQNFQRNQFGFSAGCKAGRHPVQLSVTRAGTGPREAAREGTRRTVLREVC